MERTLEELLPVVEKLADEYTGRDSTSVTYETAEMLMEAVLYCLEEVERTKTAGRTKESCPETDTRIGNSILTERAGSSSVLGAEELYRIGYGLVLEKVRQAKQLYDEILPDFQAYGNRAYQDTVTGGIVQFFLHYDAKFRPFDHLLTLDYPILITFPDLRGVDRIQPYLRCIRLEQRFLHACPEEEVKKVLMRFHDDCDELLINVCGVVYRNFLGHIMAGKRFGAAGFTEEDFALLRNKILQMQKGELEAWLSQLLGFFIDRGFEGEEELFSYLKADVPDFACELLRAAEYDCLDRIFVC